MQNEPQIVSAGNPPTGTYFPEPQLSAEMEKRFDEKYSDFFYYDDYGHDCLIDGAIPKIKHFLATALEEQRKEILSEVDGWLIDEFTEEDEWICPKCGNTVGEGYYCRNDRSKPVKETRKWEDGWQEAKNVLRAELRTKLNQLKGTK